jgi:hypothetical protein
VGELADSFRRSLKPLDEIHARLEEWERKHHEELKAVTISALKSIGLREQEAQAWLENEPDFTKEIATPLHGKRPPDKLAVYPPGGWAQRLTLVMAI